MKILMVRQSSDTVNSVYLQGLRDNGVDSVNLRVKPRLSELVGLAKFYFKEKSNFELIMTGFSSPQLAILMGLISRKKVINNATVSVYDRLVVSRGLAGKFSLKTLYYLLLDMLAAHFTDLTMVESDHQGEFFKKYFLVPERKIFRSWIGFDESRFSNFQNIPKREKFTVLFRGMFLPESGVEYAIQAAKILEDKEINFIIVGSGQGLPEIKELIDKLKPSNLELITDFIPEEKLNELMRSSHISLGQLSGHKRLARTVPYKVFESLALKLPYLTASNPAILELVTPDKTCLAFKPADARALADKIFWAKNNYSLVQKIAENGHNLYQGQLRPVILAKKLLDRIQKIK